MLQDLMIMITIIFNIQKYQEAKPNPGHLKLIRSKKYSTRRRTTKSKNEERSQEKSVQKPEVFLGCLAHREIRSDFKTSTVNGTGARSTFR